MAMQWSAIQKQNTWNTMAESQNNYCVKEARQKRTYII